MTSERGGCLVRVPLRWRDLDHQGHVYHGTLLTLLDEARTAWLRDVVRIQSPDAYVVARIEIDYLAEIRMDIGAIDVGFEVSRLGGRSIRTDEIVRTPDGGDLARAAVVIVMWDREAHRSRELTPEERRRLAPRRGTVSDA
ncbi:thioesterase family protein [Nonomuraea sp. NPDC048916]|uniref:acyl-CoA thioesterase n=1 Tax=Nonomuraea sp. NPDC048916 TaxID=3154232 RepID=UPI0033EEC055